MLKGGHHMSENYGLLGDGFRILQKCLSKYIGEALKNEYGDKWLKEELCNILKYKKGLDIDSSVDDLLLKLDHLQYLRLLKNHWNDVFRDRFEKAYDTKKNDQTNVYKAYLMELLDSRHEGAHPEVVDFSNADTYRILDTMCRLIEKIDPKSFKELRKIRSMIQSQIVVEEVKDVTIDTTKVNVIVGQTYPFSAKINDKPSKDVSWDIFRHTAQGTGISKNGLLSVASDEKATELTIIATSKVNKDCESHVTVNVINVTDIIVTSEKDILRLGEKNHFNAKVEGTNNLKKTVTWDVKGDNGSEAQSTIDEFGLLTVSKKEVASTLIITATSTDDPSQYAIKEVCIVYVTEIVINQAPEYLRSGETFYFTAEVKGSNDISQAVTWGVKAENGDKIESTIDANGLLTVSENEGVSSLTITATSVADPTKEKSINVKISNVTVVISPNGPVDLECGATQEFKADVKGTNSPSQNKVSWSVDYNNCDNTFINSNGLLTVGKEENAPEFIVIATSKYDDRKDSFVTVNIINKLSIEIYETPEYLKCGEAFQFYALINNEISEEVIWSKEGGIEGTRINSSGLLTVAPLDTSEILLITATSKKDHTKKDTATVSLRSTRRSLGSIGPAGGLIFHDEGNYEKGWRYLEAAPESSEFQAPWGLYGIACPGTNTGIGTGKNNTATIISILNENGQNDGAAQRCIALTINEHSDWFLPSKDELELMYEILCKGNNIGGFGALYTQLRKEKNLGEIGALSNLYYWSSSDNETTGSLYNTCVRSFRNGKPWFLDKDRFRRNCEYFVRAIRAF